MMFDGTSSEHERNDEDNKHFEEGSLYFIIAIWPRWSLTMVSTRRIKKYRISLSLSLWGIVVSGVVCLNHPKKILPPEKLNMHSTQATPKTTSRNLLNHMALKQYSHICIYRQQNKHLHAFISRVDLKLLNKVCRWDTPLLRTPCGVGASGDVAVFVFQRNLSLPEIVFFRKLGCKGEPKQLLYKKNNWWKWVSEAQIIK